MKNKLLLTCLLLTLFGLLLITPVGKVSASTGWNLQITNLSGTTVNYSYDQLLAMPVTNVSAALYCEGNLVTFGDWGGVSLSYLLQQAGVDPSVNSIDFLAQDGYTVSIPLEVAQQSNVIIAYAKDGAPLGEELRLVMPGVNGAVWISLITSITMDAALIDTNQFLASNAGGPNELPSMNSIAQSLAQQQAAQAHPTATPTTPKNETSTEPTAPPTNVTQPAQTTVPQQASSPKNLSFPTTVIYAIAIGATATLATASYLTLSRRRHGKTA